MASPRDLFDAGAPAWRLPSAAGAPGWVATAGAAGVGWAPPTAGRPVVALSATYRMIAVNAVQDPVGPVSAPLSAYVETTVTADAGGTLTETVLTLPGFTANVNAVADAATFQGALFAIQPKPPIASSGQRKLVTIYVTTGGATTAYPGECMAVGGYVVDQLLYTIGTIDAPVAVDLHVAGGSMAVGPVSFYTASVAPP